MPLDSFARSKRKPPQVQLVPPVKVLQNRHGNMPPLHVSIIRGVKNGSFVGSQFNIFYLVIARSEKFWRSSRGGNCVKMVPSILLGTKNNAPAIAKLQRLTGKRRQRIIHLFAAVPKLMGWNGSPFAPGVGVNGRGSLGIGQPDGPRMRTDRNERQMVFS